MFKSLFYREEGTRAARQEAAFCATVSGEGNTQKMNVQKSIAVKPLAPFANQLLAQLLLCTRLSVVDHLLALLFNAVVLRAFVGHLFKLLPYKHGPASFTFSITFLPVIYLDTVNQCPINNYPVLCLMYEENEILFC